MIKKRLSIVYQCIKSNKTSRNFSMKEKHYLITPRLHHFRNITFALSKLAQKGSNNCDRTTFYMLFKLCMFTNSIRYFNLMIHDISQTIFFLFF